MFQAQQDLQFVPVALDALQGYNMYVHLEIFTSPRFLFF